MPTGNVIAEMFVEEEADERVDAAVEARHVHDQNDKRSIRYGR